MRDLKGGGAPTLKPIYSTATQKHLRWVFPLAWTPNAKFRIGNTNMLVSKKLKFALPPTQNPNVSQWNIGCVGSQTQNSRVGHVHSFLLGVDFICVGSHFFSGIWA